MKKTTFAFAALAVIALAAASSLTTVHLFHSDDAKRFHTAWKDQFDEPVAQIRAVDAIVVARLVGTSPGRVAYSTDPGDVVPFELNHFVVEKGIKGLGAGESFTLERVGGEIAGERVVLDADGGAYTDGERYLLFVNRQPESSFFYLVNPEGRYELDAADHLRPIDMTGPVSARLAGMTVGELQRVAREARGGPEKM